MSNTKKTTNSCTKPRTLQKRNINLRNELWPELDENRLWNRKKENGFITIPRTMTYIIQILDSLSKGKPLGSTYLTIWCHLFDESFLVIENPKSFAFESGFQGQRCEDTWKKRMKKLQELGFINTGFAATRRRLTLAPLTPSCPLKEGGYSSFSAKKLLHRLYQQRIQLKNDLWMRTNNAIAIQPLKQGEEECPKNESEGG